MYAHTCAFMRVYWNASGASVCASLSHCCATVWVCPTAGTPPSIIGVLPQTGGGGGGGAGGMVDKEQIYQWIQDLSSSESYTREQALMELR